MCEMEKTDSPMADLHFRFMALAFKVRDFLSPRRTVIEEAGIRPGFHVLDYGCGPGSYIAAASELVGSAGKVYALDIHPLAVRTVQDIARKKGLRNVETILSGCETGLPEESVDAVLLYDAFHDLGDPEGVLRELHRVLKPGGTLSFSDHHMKEEEIMAGITRGDLFRLAGKCGKTYSFLKVV